jgi:hypothetical protein
MSSTQQLLLAEGGGGAAPNYIEDVFSTYLYTGTSTADNKITNNIDLATKGGMVWLKSRTGATNNYLTTNATTTSSGGGTTWLYSNTTDALLGATGTGVCNFFTDGFDINPTGTGVNDSSNNYASWTFRKQPKFFDVVTYTGNGTAGRTVAHSLGSAPGCIIVKCTTAAYNWPVYHRSVTSNGAVQLNNTAPSSSFYGPVYFGDDTNVIAPTSTVFTVGSDVNTNQNGQTYVAYVFAHDAGGFGLTGTDNVISCNSFTTDANGIASVTLGYEAQFLMAKRSTDTGDWNMFDNMRGMPVSADQRVLLANSSDAESGSYRIALNATGFTTDQFSANSTYIYIAIRRGPMKVPTDATKVFIPLVVNNDTGTTNTTNFPVDLQIFKDNRAGNGSNNVFDRLRGVTTTPDVVLQPQLFTNSTAAESTASATRYWNNTGFQTGSGIAFSNLAVWNFKRAPSFFDEVCYTGTGTVGQTFTHNLNVAPELMIIKRRNGVSDWCVYSSNLGATTALFLDADYASLGSPYGSYYWNLTAPTSNVFTVDGTGGNTYVNGSGQTYVCYLFATCAGVSKVGSYTGTGTLTTINCGFTGGARFVLIKRTDTTGDWYVWDTARGMVSGTDPSLRLNVNTTEVNADSIYTITTGFQLLASPARDVNTNGGSYIYLAIA